MKCSLLAVLSILCNTLIIQSESIDRKTEVGGKLVNSDVTKNVNYNSILTDINNFFGKNAKYQVVTDGAETNETEKPATENSNTSNANASNNAGGNANANSNTNAGNNANSNTNGNTTSKTVNTTNNNNSNNNNNNNNNKTGNNSDTKSNGKDDDEEEQVKETGCGSNRDTLGSFAFQRPFKRSVLPVNSNFTIAWSYIGIREGFEYNYPKNTVTLKLFYEADANPNNWSTAWKNPVIIKDIPVSEVEFGPMEKGVQTYRYNWHINQAECLINLKTNEKYKLRIYGDGKDVQSNNGNFTCYNDGDIQPGITVAFYIVDNNRIAENFYRPIAIDDKKDSGIKNKSSLMMSLIIAIFLMLYNYY